MMPTMTLEQATEEVCQDATAAFSTTPLHPSDAHLYVVPGKASILHVPYQVGIGTELFGGIVSNIKMSMEENLITELTVLARPNFAQITTATTQFANYNINNNTTASNITIGGSGDYYSWPNEYSIRLRGVNTNGSTVYYVDGYQQAENKEAAFIDKIRRQLAPTILTKNTFLWGIKITDAERRARSLLHDLIGNDEFERYIRKGFIMVKGRSGTLYKISGGHNRIISYVKDATGRFVPYENFCVVFKVYDLPFTDGVIMRKMLVEHDEFALRKLANVGRVSELEKVQHLNKQQRMAV
jgi:hypothetical protein